MYNLGLHRHTVFAITALLFMLLNGCNTTRALPHPISAQSRQPLLHFQKTPCFGTCPAYNAMIYENGSVSFVEYRNALAQDTLWLQLPPAEMQQLNRELEALNYKSLQRSYFSNWSDISSTYLTFYEAGEEVKRVKHEEGGPQQLVQFQEWLHNVLWQQAEEKKRPTY